MRIDVIVVRIGKEIGHVVADLAEIDRQLAAVRGSDRVLFRKSADFIHYFVHHDRRIVALGKVGAGEVGLQITVDEAARVKGYAASLLDIIHKQICDTNMRYGIHQQSSRRNGS